MIRTNDAQDKVTSQDGVQIDAKEERSTKEVELLKQMRAKVADLDPDSTDIDDATLLRFLRAKSMDVTKGSKMFAEHQKWRCSYLPRGHALEDEIKDELDADKFFIQGQDKRGRPIAVLIGNKHYSSRDCEQYKRAITYFLDKLISGIPPGEETFVIIADLKDIRYKNLDPRGWLAALHFLQAYYPERMGKIFVLHTPFIFWGAWKLVSPFIDPVTAAKISFVQDDKTDETLSADISKEEMPIMYGGLKELVSLRDAQPANWPPCKDT